MLKGAAGVVVAAWGGGGGWGGGEGGMHQLDRAPKMLPRPQTIANSVCTSRRSHVDKQLPILYVRRDDFLGRAAALRLFMRPERRGPQVSVVRASAPGDGPHPRRPQGL